MNISMQDWWRQLEPQWKQAFSVTVFQHAGEPAPAELDLLFTAQALRFAGPSAPYPNMRFELTNLSGVQALCGLETLVVIFHRVESLAELKALQSLKNLFLYNNCIKTLEGIEELTGLERLYVQDNQIGSIRQVEKMHRLRELYVNGNLVSDLDGLTEDHAENLQAFFCQPNAHLKQKEMMRVERELGIRCRKA
jgi:hypothetical protein